MAFPKKHLFLPEHQIVSTYGFAISHPARFMILYLLSHCDGMYFYELEKHIPLSQGTISGHLKILRDIQFIEVEVRGLYNWYSFRQPVIQHAVQFMFTQFMTLNLSPVNH